MSHMQRDPVIHDNGGSRSGKDRRQNIAPYEGPDNRSGKDRRKGGDRRSGRARRRVPDRRGGGLWNVNLVERRDAFRNRTDDSP